MPKLMKSRWFNLTVMLLLCGGFVASIWIRGDHSGAAFFLVLTLVIALALLAAGRSKRFRRQLFDTDERFEAIDLLSGMWAGATLFLAVFICFLVENARGHSGEPYLWLSALWMGTYLAFFFVRSVRK